MNWVAFNSARDFVLNPKPTQYPLNMLGYPYAEIGEDALIIIMQKQFLYIFISRESMKRESLAIIGAVFTFINSLLFTSTFFLVFGMSTGVLAYFTTLEYTRIPLAILTIALFFIWVTKI